MTEDTLVREEHLAWKIAELAAATVQVPSETLDMVRNRIIDNAAVSAAAVTRRPVMAARVQAQAHRKAPGASLLGVRGTYSPGWAAWANGVALGELDFHDTIPAAVHAHPGDTIPALVAVAQHAGLRGADLVRGVAAAYEVHLDLARRSCLQEREIDQLEHLGPSVAAGLGAMLQLSPETIYAAIGQVLSLTAAARQSPGCRVSKWNAYAPAYAGKVAIEAVDRAMRGEGVTTSISDRDGVLAWLLARPEDACQVPLPAPGEPMRAILDSYAKEHAAAYPHQVPIDLARRMRQRIGDISDVVSVVLHTSHHAHAVLGTGSNDRREFDPGASHDILVHSVTYVFAVALQDGAWHHEQSYSPARAHRADTTELRRRISTVEDPDWTHRYHSVGAEEKSFGVRAAITLTSGDTIVDELVVPDAHPLGARPFERKQYIEKFTELAEGVIDKREQQRFLDVVSCLGDLKRGSLDMLNLLVDQQVLDQAPTTHGIFR
jgi:2-methylcitrate dehydratase